MRRFIQPTTAGRQGHPEVSYRPREREHAGDNLFSRFDILTPADYCYGIFSEAYGVAIESGKKKALTSEENSRIQLPREEEVDQRTEHS